MGGNLGPCPCPTALLPVLASPEDECSLCALSCLQGFQATASSQGGTSGAARAGDRNDQTSRAPHPEGEAVRWALIKRGRPVARPPARTVPRSRFSARSEGHRQAKSRLTLASASSCLGLRSPTLPLIVAQLRGAAPAAADEAPARLPLAAAAGVKSQSLAEAPGLAAKTRLLKEPEGRGETRRGPGVEPGCWLIHLRSCLGLDPHPNQKEAGKL